MSELVTVGMPVFNGEPFVAEAVASLLAQDHDPLEILIADNASTDATLECCRDLAARDPRVRFLTSDRNRGAAWNYNRLVAEARGSLFKWAAADDVCRPAFVSACVRALDAEGPGTVIAFPRSDLIDEHGERIRPVDDSALAVTSPAPWERVGQLLENRFEWHPVFGVMRTDVARSTELIGPYVAADIVFLAEMAMRGRFVQVPETLFLRRYHARRPLVASLRFEDQAAWFDTSGGGGAQFPQLNVGAALVRAARRSGLPAGDAARCAAAAARAYILPHWRHIGGEVKLAARARIRRTRRATPTRSTTTP
jgi:glycosyltransferase involved in cell wall biosynthesis